MPRLPRKCLSTNTNLFARRTVIKNIDLTSNTFWGAMSCKREIEIEISKNLLVEAEIDQHTVQILVIEQQSNNPNFLCND